MHKALIVDSQPLAALLMGDELQGLGFSCRSAADNRAAMSLLTADRSWNLLVMEYRAVSAGVGGPELSRLGRTLNADIRILYVSESAVPQSSLARGEYFLQRPYEIDELRSVVTSLGLGGPQETSHQEEHVGQQPTGWRIDPSTRKASRGNVVLGYDLAAEGRLQVTILAGGGDEETNCIIAGEAMAAIEERMRRA